jgi:enamine deaminase RidA (YjgF/YER057c/UK114 family)
MAPLPAASHFDNTQEPAVSLNATNPRNTDAAPRSLLSSQTVAFSHYNNLSAQLPIDPATGELVAGGASEQARQCLESVRAVVESIGTSWTTSSGSPSSSPTSPTSTP